MNQSDNNSNTHQVAVNSAKAWRNEAEAIDRSPSHLNKIDRVLAESPVEKANNKELVSLSNRDFKAMQKDREEFKQKYSQSPAQTAKEKEGELVKNPYSNTPYNLSSRPKEKVRAI